MADNPSRKTAAPSSDNKFSFPVILPPPPALEFEFDSVTAPASPASPADHLFSNGKLLPHVFPVVPHNAFPCYYSRSTSTSSGRASSIGSKDSLMSSRSNSASSNCSSARTSTSEAASLATNAGRTTAPAPARQDRNRTRPVLGTQGYSHGSSQRWQLIAAAPVLSHQGSRSYKAEKLERKGSTKSRGTDIDQGRAKSSWFGKKILKALVSACKECHAI